MCKINYYDNEIKDYSHNNNNVNSENNKTTKTVLKKTCIAGIIIITASNSFLTSFIVPYVYRKGFLKAR
jgi:hypothetical protein